MNDYINRNTAIDDLKEILNDPNCPLFISATVYQILESIPSADVRPVVHGEWEPGNPICPVCGEDKFKGLDADIWADWQPPFCPNCGAYNLSKEGL